jgi:hypothetical protein
MIQIKSDARRFQPPWSVEEPDACFIVRDGNGQALAYVYFRWWRGGRCGLPVACRTQ